MMPAGNVVFSLTSWSHFCTRDRRNPVESEQDTTFYRNLPEHLHVENAGREPSHPLNIVRGRDQLVDDATNST